MSKTLSVCMIVKNEEKNLPRCLDSIKDFADEIIVVDTGSSDKSVEIAKSYGAKIGYFKWNNNFSDARNASLEMATKDWILFLDADEEISKEEFIKLKNTINTTPLEAFHCRLVNIIQNTNIGDAIVLRTFKNNPNYRFRGKMHEQIIFSIQEVSGESSIGLSDIKITHYGYDPQVSDMDLKQKRNLELLESYDEKDKDGYYYYSLGNEYSRINDPNKALETYYKAYNPDCRSSYMPYLCVNISKTLFGCKRYYDEINAICEFEKIYPDLRDIYFLKALAYIECSMFTKARESIMSYFSCDLEEFIYPNNNFDSLYNIAELLTKVKKGCIPHDENLISALIVAPTQVDFLINTFKSLNEICDEILVVTPKESNLNREMVRNYGAKIIETDTTDIGENFMIGTKNVSCKFTLFIKPNELLPTDSQKQLASTLKVNPDIQFLNLITLNTRDNSTLNEFRVFKNSDNIKDIKYFNTFTTYVENSTRQQANIIINSY